MNKKILLFIVCIVVGAVVFPVSSIKTKDISLKSTVTYKEDFENDFLIDYPVMDVPLSFIEPDKLSPKPIAKTNPAEFNWANYNGKDWTTPAKNQGHCGSCWDFAALGVFESVIKINENCPDFNPDLSEQYVLSCLPKAGSCYGGSSAQAFNLIIDTTQDGNYHNGVISEECFPYKTNDKVPCSDKCENWEDILVPLLDYSSWKADGTNSDRENIKTQIIEKGPVVAHMKATDNFKTWGVLNHSPTAYFFNFLNVFGINHVVMVLGWKDSVLIPNGGYWICKNSWGSRWGYNGFFNIAYGSLNIDKYWIISPDYDPDSYNWPPIVDTGGSYGGILNNEVTFDASKSVGVEGEIIDYSWNFGDGTTGNGVTTGHTYLELGKFTVTLNITDSKNNKASGITSIWVQESNEPPNKPTITGTTPGKIWRNYEYNFSSIDPEGNDVWYLVDWGDGTPQEWLGPYNSDEKLTISHFWDKKGTYTIKAKAKDVFNDESEWGTLEVTMPRNKIPSKYLFFELFYKILNNFLI